MKLRIVILSFILIPCILIDNIATRAQESGPVNLIGHLQFLAIDEIDRATGEWSGGFAQILNTEDGKVFEIEDPKRVLKMRTPGRISISGRRIGNKVVAEQGSLIPPDPKLLLNTDRMAAASQTETIGEQKTLVALFNYPDKPIQPFTLQEVKDKVINNPDSVDNFIRENSYGKTWFNADFIDWHTLPNDSIYYDAGCFADLNLLYEAINTIDNIVDFRNYSRLIFIHADVSANNLCAQASLGKVGLSSPGRGSFTASFALINEESFQSHNALAHEFGHNLGFYHASSVLSIPESLLDPTYSGGSWGEYGDVADTMGATSDYGHFSDIWRAQAQWIESSQIQDAMTSGDYVLDQVILPSNGVKALRIPLGRDVGGNDFYYWIEYRKDLGAFIGPFDKEDSIQVRTKSSSRGTGTGLSLGWANNSVIFKFFAFGGGSISGRVTKDSEGTGLQGISVCACDTNWNSVECSNTDSFGDYTLSGLPPASYYVRTWNFQGYIDEWYDNVITTDQSAATLVSVTQRSETSNINFGLSVGYSNLAREIRSNSTAVGLLTGRSEAGTSSVTGFADVEIDKPFRDPYRGIKLELIEKTGSGTESKARLRVTLSGVDIKPAGTLNFGDVIINNICSNVVTVTNNTGTGLNIGTVSVGGRNPETFTISNDGCSGTNLLENESCVVSISVSPYSEGMKFGVLLVPTSDSTRAEGTISLYGKGIVIPVQDLMGPCLSVMSHTHGQHVGASSITLAGTASDSGKGSNGIQQLTVNGARANNDTATGSGTATWSKAVTLNPGANPITVVAYDDSPNHNQTCQTMMIYYDAPIIYVSKDANAGSCSGHYPCYPNIQDGIASASAPSIIEIGQETYIEDTILNFDQIINLRGGWDTNFTSNASYTTIQGSITITHGTMILENIILK